MSENNSIWLESEAGFRVLFECATISILVVNKQGRIDLSNPCAEKLFGYEVGELIGKPVEVLIPENLREKHKNHRNIYFEGPKSRPMGSGLELYAIKKNGTVFPVEISLGHYALENERVAVAFITDISNQVEAKKLIAERESWFRNMADNSPIMIWLSRPSKLRSYFNQTWLEYAGETPGKLLERNWVNRIHHDDRNRFEATFDEAFDARKSYTVEYRLRRHDDTFHWLREVGKPIYTPENQFTGYIGTCLDINDQRLTKEALELQIQQRTLELSDALKWEKEINEMKSRFVSMASHEFRTPLSIVLSSTSLIEQYSGDAVDDRILKHIKRIKGAVTNLTSILNDFLSLDKLEQGKTQVERQEINVIEFMQEVIEDVRFIQKKGQDINIVLQGEEQICLDKKKLRHVMENLVSNAIKYSPEEATINLNVDNGENSIVITVEDKGMGIPEEEQKYMYEKFFRAQNAGNIQGTGLGLTIVKRYVDLMGGHIRFLSKEGEGTTFVIEFPQPSFL